MGPIQASFTAKDRETNQGMPPGYGGEFAISTAILTVHGSRAPLALPQPMGPFFVSPSAEVFSRQKGLNRYTLESVLAGPNRIRNLTDKGVELRWLP